MTPKEKNRKDMLCVHDAGNKKDLHPEAGAGLFRSCGRFP
jgi:hypothetical protein